MSYVPDVIRGDLDSLPNLNNAEEEDMGVMTIDAVFRTFNIRSNNPTEIPNLANRGAI